MIKTNKLDSRQIDDIIGLFNECREYDGLTASLTLPDAGEECPDELFLLQYEKNTLTGFMSVFSADESFVEIYGLTKPSHRKKGVFTSLLYAAKADGQFINGRDILYISDGKSNDCTLAYKHLNFDLNYSEYIMKKETPFANDKASSFTMQKADDSVIKQLYPLIFDIPAEYTEEALEGAMDDNTLRFTFALDKKDVGMVFLTPRKDGSVYLLNFGLLPKYRGQKLSYEMLSDVFKYAAENYNAISLQVSSGNLPAFRLYRRFGFKTASQISYYSDSGEFLDLF